VLAEAAAPPGTHPYMLNRKLTVDFVCYQQFFEVHMMRIDHCDTSHS